jgi:glucose/arabinose dehydrogenase
LAFDDQGYLFITVGEYGNRVDLLNQRAHPAQDLTNYLGTVVRLHDDGRIPADNPFASRADARPGIWSYGHRSPQGLAIHPENGDIWETEHGPQGGDELNLIRRGANYGWPVIGFGVDYGGGIIHVGTELEGLEQPVHHWVPSIATSGLLIYSGDRYPAWRGNFFVGGLAGQQLARLSVDGQRVTGEETLFEGIGRVREIVQGPDGYIYLALDARGGGTSPVLRIEVAN